MVNQWRNKCVNGTREADIENACLGDQRMLLIGIKKYFDHCHSTKL